MGYGCTTCIGNSRPLIPEVKVNFLASSPLVIAYALAGSMRVDLLKDPLGTYVSGERVFLKDIWPTTADNKELVNASLAADMFTGGYADVYRGDENWRGMEVPAGGMFAWSNESSYMRKPPYF